MLLSRVSVHRLSAVIATDFQVAPLDSAVLDRTALGMQSQRETGMQSQRDLKLKEPHGFEEKTRS